MLTLLKSATVASGVLRTPMAVALSVVTRCCPEQLQHDGQIVELSAEQAGVNSVINQALLPSVQ